MHQILAVIEPLFHVVVKDDCANPLILLPCCDSITSATVRWGCMRQELFCSVELLYALWFGLLFFRPYKLRSL